MINLMPAARLIKELGEGKHLEIDHPDLEEDIWNLFIYDDGQKLDRDEQYSGHLSMPGANWYFNAYFSHLKWTWILEIVMQARTPLTVWEKEAVAA